MKKIKTGGRRQFGMIVLLLGVAVVTQGAIIGLDNFEAYTNNSALTGTSKVPDSPWARYGSAYSDFPVAKTGVGVDGTTAMQFTAKWDLANYVAIRYEYATPANLSACSTNLQLRVTMKDIRTSSIATDTTVEARIQFGDGTQYTGSPVSFVATSSFTTYTFDINADAMTRNLGTGSFDLTNVSSIDLFWRNTSGVTNRNQVVMDNFELVYEKRAMWVWSSQTWLDDAAAWTNLISFCGEQGIDELFLSTKVTRTNDGGVWTATLQSPTIYSSRLAVASQAGVRVHALFSGPRFALDEYHDEILAITAEIVAFNAAGSSNQRFAGIHLDVEPHSDNPYTKEAWDAGGEARAQLLYEWVGMHVAVGNYLLTNAPELEFGVDLPFWLDTQVDGLGNLMNEITYDSVTTNVAAHIFPRVDNVGLMSYRTTATGAGSVTGVSSNELLYASAAGTKLYLGLNTMPVSSGVPADSTFGGRTLEELNACAAAVSAAATEYSGFEGIAIHHYATFLNLTERILDDFEAYTNGAILTGSSKVAGSRWEQYGSAYATAPNAQTLIGVDDSTAMYFATKWNSGNYVAIEYDYPEPVDLSECSTNLQLQVSMREKRTSSIAYDTTVEARVEFGDGTQYTGSSVSFVIGSSFQTYVFDIQESAMTRTSGSGSFNLSNVSSIHLIWRNTSGSRKDRNEVVLDNFRLTAE